MTQSDPLTPVPVLSEDAAAGRYWWWQHLTAYHWFVLLVASMAWFFDCLDQRIFSLARIPALQALKLETATNEDVQNFGKIVTAFFLIGWGIGGMIFGSLGDKFGRSRMLTLSILTYSIFTGLSFFSRTWFDFTLFRFLTGLGVGGVFGLAVALIAETVPSVARTQSLGLLQMLSAIGNITASLVMMGMTALEKKGIVPGGQSWRFMFLVGALPAVMVVFTGAFLREPEPWLDLKARGMLPTGSIFAPYARLFADRRWRRNLIIGALIASTGVIGLWAIGEYAPDLQRNVFTAYYQPGRSKEATKALVDGAIANAYLLQQIGAAVGMWAFTRFAILAGRRAAFAVGFTAALLCTAFVYWKVSTPLDAYWMMPMMGAAQLGIFAGFSIYLPELFPSALRSTGTSFCYNLGRFAAAGGSFFSAALANNVFHAAKGSPLPYRYSAITMCAVFLIGLATLPFAPETKGKPLPQ